MNVNVINSFAGDFAFLSNFYPCNVEFNGLWFPTVEHAFQAAKSSDVNVHFQFTQIPAGQAGKAKRAGRLVAIRHDWEGVKVSIMKLLLTRKFRTNPVLGKQLISTGDVLLVEGNHWHDNTWGDCTCSKCAHIQGRNILGNLLMEVRKELLYSGGNPYERKIFS